MQALTEKNAQLSQELQECKAQLEAALAAAGGDSKTPPGNTFVLINIGVVRHARKSNNDCVGTAGQEPDRQALLRGSAGKEQAPGCQRQARRGAERRSSRAVRLR